MKKNILLAKTTKKPISIQTIIMVCLLFLLACIYLFPLAMALVNSFKTRSEMFTNILALPTQWNLDNYARSYAKMNYLRSFFNTATIAIIGLSGIVLFSSLGGWALSRTKTKLSKLVFALFVFSMLIPFNAVMIPLYQVARNLRLSNSVPGMGAIYIGLGVGMAIFMYHGFVKSIPMDLEDAATIDGCSFPKTFWHVIFPLLLPVSATVVIMNLLWMWNDFLLPLIMLRNSRKYTLLLSTNMLFGQYSSDWPAILSALILTVIPVIVFYILLQKNILRGIADGALKG